MKHVLKETLDESGAVYQTIMEVKDFKTPKNLKQFEFSSIWTGAKNPKEPQRKYSLILDKEGVKSLRKILDDLETE